MKLDVVCAHAACRVFFLPGFASWCRKKAEEQTTDHLNPLKVLHELEEVMSNDAIMVADGGDFVGSAAYIVR